MEEPLEGRNLPKRASKGRETSQEKQKILVPLVASRFAPALRDLKELQVL